MQKTALRALLESVQQGDVPVDQALALLRDLPFTDLGFATVDHHRALRTGLPEVVFGAGKTLEHLIAIVAELRSKGHSTLVTRVSPEQAAELTRAFPKIDCHPLARTAFLSDGPAPPRGQGTICVVSAGTSDASVAAEAVVTARAFGNQVSEVYDVGVAGLHRLLARRETLYQANVIIAIAGMEGALASVIGGLVSRPVIAVPTSVGYGASFHGLAALLAMLNSCASGVTVVNIDNGFGAAYAATLINQPGLSA